MERQDPRFTASANVSNILQAFYPDILTSTYSVPPVYFNKVPFRREIVPGTDLPSLVLQQPICVSDSVPSHDLSTVSLLPMPVPPRNLWSFQPQQKKPRKPQKVLQSDNRDDAIQAQVIRNLQVFGENRKEAMFIISQLNFMEYLNDPEYAEAVSMLPGIPMDPKTGRKVVGDFDVLVISRQHGILIGELKTVGQDPVMRTDAVLNKVIWKGLKQLDKAKAVMSHLVSDLTSQDLPVRTTLILPFVSSQQLQRVLAGDPQLEKNACSTLGAADAAEAARLCCCSNQLSNPDEWWNVTPNVLTQLEEWWHCRMQPSLNMAEATYLELVARFVGPATSITVHTNTGPRIQVKGIDQAISELGQRLTTLILTPDQIQIMQSSEDMPLVFLTGPPGTGKTVMLTLIGLCWLQQGKDVHVISGWNGCRAVSSLIKKQLETTLAAHVTSPPGCGKVLLHHYDLFNKAEKDRAVRELAACGPDLHVIMDELGGVGGLEKFGIPKHLPDLVEELQNQCNLRFWAAGIVHSVIPPKLLAVKLTTPLRSAPAVLREVEKGINNWQQDVLQYDKTRFPAPGDGLRVERLEHENCGYNGHYGDRPEDCFLCGKNVASVLRRLGVGVPGSQISNRDVFILSHDMTSFWKTSSDGTTTTTADRGFVRSIRQAGLAVRVMVDRQGDAARWEKEVKEVAEATLGEIIVTSCDSVLGLERKVVVLVCGGPWCMLHAASRATAQLVVVSSSTSTHSTFRSLPRPRLKSSFALTRSASFSLLEPKQNQPQPTVYSTRLPAPRVSRHVERLVHEDSGRNGHTSNQPENCFLCGQNVATMLRRLGVGSPGSQFSCGDVFILSSDASSLHNPDDMTADLVHGVQHDGLAVREMADHQLGTAEAAEDSIIVTDCQSVQGLERKVLVVLGGDKNLMLFASSRATVLIVVDTV